MIDMIADFWMMIIFDWHDRYDCGFLDDDYFLIGMMCMIGVFGWRLKYLLVIVIY